MGRELGGKLKVSACLLMISSELEGSAVGGPGVLKGQQEGVGYLAREAVNKG